MMNMMKMMTKTLVGCTIAAWALGAAASSSSCSSKYSLHVDNHTNDKMIKVTEGLWARSERVLMPNESVDFCQVFGINAVHVTYFNDKTHQFEKIEHCPRGDSFVGEVSIDVTGTSPTCQVDYIKHVPEYETENY